ncbi:MAG: hypothetical protein HYX72_00695 [Acidobacteria bacterium]|nr:hypothetical protein [Acidobacteriota bacterium]
MIRHPKFLLLPLLAAPLFLAGCAATTIARIKADPSRYQSKNVAVRGTVVNSVGVLSTGGYEVDDGTGRIYVISNRGVPSSGTRVTVEGRVFSGATILGQAMGVAIRESKHKVH